MAHLTSGTPHLRNSCCTRSKFNQFHHLALAPDFAATKLSITFLYTQTIHSTYPLLLHRFLVRFSSRQCPGTYKASGPSGVPSFPTAPLRPKKPLAFRLLPFAILTSSSKHTSFLGSPLVEHRTKTGSTLTTCVPSCSPLDSSGFINRTQRNLFLPQHPRCRLPQPPALATAKSQPSRSHSVSAPSAAICCTPKRMKSNASSCSRVAHATSPKRPPRRASSAMP